MSIFNTNIRIIGPTSSSSLGVQDGTGRMQYYWNSTPGPNTKYLVSSEPAFKLDIPVVGTNYFAVKFAPNGVKDQVINWREDFVIKNNGSIGIGISNPRNKLHVNGTIENKSHTIMSGITSKYILSVQDGTGRIQHYWNSSRGKEARYLISNEPAFKLDIAVAGKNYFKIKYSPPGISNQVINWREDLTINQLGNVGIGSENPSEKLEVNGNVKCNNLYFSDNSFYDDLFTNTYFKNKLQNTIQYEQVNIFNSIKDACSSLYGNFVYDSSENSDTNIEAELVDNISLYLTCDDNNKVLYQTKNTFITSLKLKFKDKFTHDANLNSNLLLNGWSMIQNNDDNSLLMYTTNINKINSENKFNELYLLSNANTLIDISDVTNGNELEILNENILINNQHLNFKMIPNINHYNNNISINKMNSYVCSGSFITVSDDDLSLGIFLTAAHCVMEISDNILYKTQNLYITNPITQNWTYINNENIYYDGVADIAIIKTNIDFTEYSHIPLRLSSYNPSTGDKCFICGNPGGYDNISFSNGVIRDTDFNETGGYQIVNSLFTNIPAIGGNSGSSILNISGEIIGLYTFGISGYETLGGGANLSVLKQVLAKLLLFPDTKRNTLKKYLGFKWYVLSPISLANLYNDTSNFKNQGIYLYDISVDSPFYNVLQIGDLILSATINSNIYDFGILQGQYTPGVLLYHYDDNLVNLEIVRNKTIINIENIDFTKTYNDVSELLDNPLSTGMIKNNTGVYVPT